MRVFWGLGEIENEMVIVVVAMTTRSQTAAGPFQGLNLDDLSAKDMTADQKLHILEEFKACDRSEDSTRFITNKYGIGASTLRNWLTRQRKNPQWKPQGNPKCVYCIS